MKLLKLLILLLPITCYGQNIYSYFPFNLPSTVTADNSGSVLYVSGGDLGRIWRIDLATGNFNVYAGMGVVGYGGDGGPATSALFTGISNLVVNKHGDLFFFDGANFRLRKIEKSTGIITTVAGNGINGYPTMGVDALTTTLPPSTFIAIDTFDNIYVANLDEAHLMKIDAVTNIITNFAGTGSGLYSGDGGPALSAEIGSINAMCIDKQNNIYIATLLRIRKIDAQGIITTVAGDGMLSCDTVGGSSLSSSILPECIIAGNNNDLFISEADCAIIKRLDLNNQTISTVAGIGIGGYSGDNGPANNARLDSPKDITVDSCGNLYICDLYNDRIRRVNFAPSCHPLEIDNISIVPLSLSIYPNPANSWITITSSEKINTVSIFDAVGRVALQRIVNNGKVTMDVSGLSPGVYFVRVGGNVMKFARE